MATKTEKTNKKRHGVSSRSFDATSNQNLTELNTNTQSTSTFEMELPDVRVPLRLKVIIPYMILTVIMALIGASIISRIVRDSLEARFLNQLIETGKLAADRMVIEENTLLQAIRLLTNIEGMSEAVQNADAARLRELVLPIAINNELQSIDILDLNGMSLLSMQHQVGMDIGTYRYEQGSSIFAEWHIVQQVLVGELDQGRDKFSGIATAPWGEYFYISSPLFDDSGNLVGVVLVGKSLSDLLIDFREDTLAQTSVYDLNGDLIASTLILADESMILSEQNREFVLTQQADSSLTRPLQVGSIAYREVLGPWEVRSGTDIGFIGSALPVEFLTVTSSSTRIQIFLLTLAGVLLVVGVGFFIARQITKPLENIMIAIRKIRRGDFDVKVKPTSNDELMVLTYGLNRMVAGLKEITIRRLREARLRAEIQNERELNELKSRFVSMVSHEFRTPLATILSSSQYLQRYEHRADTSKREKHYDRITTSVTRMTNLLEDVLVIGRSESGRLNFEPTKVNFGAMVEVIVEDIQFSVQSAHQIDLKISGDLRNVHIDENLMTLVITNLLTNAIKYSPEADKVHFWIDGNDRRIKFAVKDYGLGIPQADRDNLFQPFHRANNVGGIPGTGLGLYITRLVIELHGGQIKVNSRDGIGTTFTVRIPKLKSENLKEVQS